MTRPTSAAEPSYPRKALIVFRLTNQSDAALDSAAAYDVIVSSMERPEVVADVRARNPNLRWLYRWMPQMTIDNAEEETFWYPDTTWSLRRLVQLYAIENDWYLRTTNGDRIKRWDHWILNWTRHCPAGTYGTSRGLTYAQWLARVAMPQIIKNSPDWEPWGWGSSSFDALWFEVMVDCFGSFVIPGMDDADPDLDGLPEGVYDYCTEGGAEDPLSVLMREVNEQFYLDFSEEFQDQLPYVMNMNSPEMGPSWRNTSWGAKVERWKDPNRPAQDWWDWFYGLRNYNGTELWGPGYEYAERYYHPFAADDRAGWDVSFLQLHYNLGWPHAVHDRWVRFALGTTLLGDGYMVYTPDEAKITWIDPFDWDLGDPLSDYVPEPWEGGAANLDTLYYRPFTEGLVLVNPHDGMVRGVPPEDAFIGFWLTVEDLEVESVEAHSATVTWTAPDGDVNDVDSFEVRYSTSPLDTANWDEASIVPGGRFVGIPGFPVEAAIPDLEESTTYYAAVRNVILDHEDPDLSNVVSWTTEGEADLQAPAPVTDLTSPRRDETWIDLVWTATGDDGFEGLASAYEIRYLRGRVILTEGDWDIAKVAPDPPPPGLPGSRQTYRLQGLDAGGSYGIAVRVYDEVPNESALSPPLLVQPDASSSPEPPADRSAALRVFPNPAFDDVEVDLSTDRPGWMKVDLTDVQGRRVGTLFEGWATQGRHRFRWSGGRLPGGLYMVRVTTSSGIMARKLLVTR